MSSSHRSHGSHISHGSSAGGHSRHAIHGNHTNHASTNPKPNAGNYNLYWTEAPDLGHSMEDKLIEIGHNIELLAANKGPWADLVGGVAVIDNPDVPLDESVYERDEPVDVSNQNALIDSINDLYQWMNATSSTANNGARPLPDLITESPLAVDAILLEDTVEALATADLSSKHSSHWSTYSGVGYNNHTNSLGGHTVHSIHGNHYSNYNT